MLVRRHVGAAVADLIFDAFVIDGLAAGQRRAAEQADEFWRAALRQLVVAHPALIKIDFLAAGRTALRSFSEFVDFKSALIVVLHGGCRLTARRLLPRLLLRGRPDDRC